MSQQPVDWVEWLKRNWLIVVVGLVVLAIVLRLVGGRRRRIIIE